MIDWAAVKWNPAELAGVTRIEILPTINGDDNIAVQINWYSGDQIIRRDAHIEVLKMPPMDGIAST